MSSDKFDFGMSEVSFGLLSTRRPNIVSKCLLIGGLGVCLEFTQNFWKKLFSKCFTKLTKYSKEIGKAQVNDWVNVDQLLGFSEDHPLFLGHVGSPYLEVVFKTNQT